MAKKRANKLDAIKDIAKGAFVGSLLGAAVGIKNLKEDKGDRDDYLRFLVRLDLSASLLKEVIAATFSHVNELGLPVHYEDYQLRQWEQKAKLIWSGDIQIHRDDSDKILH